MEDPNARHHRRRGPSLWSHTAVFPAAGGNAPQPPATVDRQLSQDDGRSVLS